jgi:hypothetical protein
MRLVPCVADIAVARAAYQRPCPMTASGGFLPVRFRPRRKEDGQ